MYFTFMYLSCSYLPLLLTKAFKYSTFQWLSLNLSLPTKASMCLTFLWLLQSLYIYPKSVFSIFSPDNTINLRNPTSQLSNCVIHLVKPFAGKLPSYIHYSKHFIQLLESADHPPTLYPSNTVPQHLLTFSFTGSAHTFFRYIIPYILFRLETDQADCNSSFQLIIL